MDMGNSASISPASSLDQLWMVPYARNPFFGGREEELQAIADQLKEKQNGASGLALCGVGGIGKTQLALEYAYRHRAEYRHIFWALAETRETLNAAWSDIAALLALPEQGQQEQRRIVEAVTGWLGENPAWLLILDFAGDPAVLKDFLPGTCNGHVIFTTRVHTLGKLARRMRIKTLTLEQSSRLLLRRSGLLRGADEVAEPDPKDAEAARTLASQLDCLPLALNVAGAYLAETSCGLPGYIERLSAMHIAPPNSAEASDGEQPDPLLKVVRLSGAKVARTGSAAAHLLSLCSFLAPDEIPENLLVACLPTLQKSTRRLLANTAKRNAALALLHKYALLERDLAVQSLTMPREIQVAWRSFFSADEERSWAEQAVRALGSLFATLDMNDWEACQRLLPHAQMCAAFIERWKLEIVEGAWLLHHMGWYLHTRGQYTEAQMYEERALAIYRAVLGDEHPSTAMILNNLAVTYEDQGKLNDAATLHTQALAIRRSVLGENHLETAASLNNLALVYHDQGRLDDAASLYRQALAVRTQLLGDMHPDIATLLADLAALYADQGKFKEALSLYQQALAIRRKALGGRHADTIALLGGMAAIYQAQGDYVEALRWRQQALTAQRKALGYQHSDLAATFSAIATIYQAQGQLDESAFWLQHSLAILHNIAAEVPIEQARHLETLAIAYEEQEQHEKAEAFYQQALARYRSVPNDHPLDIARCSYNLALLYYERKRAVEGRPLLEQAIALWQEQRGPNHPDTRKAREKYEQLTQKQQTTRAKRGQATESSPAEPERSNSGGLKSIARAIRRVGRKKT